MFSIHGAMLEDMLLDIGSVIEVIRGAKELVNAARVPAMRANGQRQVEEVRRIIEVLRSIYFSPRGVLKLLEEIVEGRHPTEEQIEIILPAFNDYDFHMARMLVRLDPIDRGGFGKLTLRAERALREISNEKMRVRQRVQYLLNESLTMGRLVSREDASKLRDEIVALNLAIEDAEEALVVALR